MAETTARSRIDNSAMKIANILGPDHLQTSESASQQPDKRRRHVPLDLDSINDCPRDVVSTPMDFRSPIIAGDIPMVQALCDCIRSSDLPLPLRSMLAAALSGSSVPMLEHLFSLGAKLDVSMDSLPPNVTSTPRSTDFFACLVTHGWPLGPRGLALNIHRGPEVVRLILGSGSRVGFLCMKSAVQNGNVETAEMLLPRLNPRTKVPTAFDYSANLENSERWYGPEMNSEEPSISRIMNQAGFLQIAASRDHVDMIRWLISKGADVDSMPSKECCCWDVNGSALGSAVAAGSVEVVWLLLELGADPHLKNEDGRTPVDLNGLLGRRPAKEMIEEFLRAPRRAREGG